MQVRTILGVALFTLFLGTPILLAGCAPTPPTANEKPTSSPTPSVSVIEVQNEKASSVEEVPVPEEWETALALPEFPLPVVEATYEEDVWGDVESVLFSLNVQEKVVDDYVAELTDSGWTVVSETGAYPNQEVFLMKEDGLLQYSALVSSTSEFYSEEDDTTYNATSVYVKRYEQVPE